MNKTNKAGFWCFGIGSAAFVGLSMINPGFIVGVAVCFFYWGYFSRALLIGRRNG